MSVPGNRLGVNVQDKEVAASLKQSGVDISQLTDVLPGMHETECDTCHRPVMAARIQDDCPVECIRCKGWSVDSGMDIFTFLRELYDDAAIFSTSVFNTMSMDFLNAYQSGQERVTSITGVTAARLVLDCFFGDRGFEIDAPISDVAKLVLDTLISKFAKEIPDAQSKFRSELYTRVTTYK